MGEDMRRLLSWPDISEYQDPSVDLDSVLRSLDYVEGIGDYIGCPDDELILGSLESESLDIGEDDDYDR